MLKEQRQDLILERITKDSRVYVTTLSTELGVSDDTIRRDIETTMLGGRIIGPSQVTAGNMAYRALENIYPDWTIVGVSDIHPVKGLMRTIQEEALIKRSFLEQGGKRGVIATSNKLNTAGHYRFGSLSEIDYLVVEDDRKAEIQSEWPNQKYTIL